MPKTKIICTLGPSSSRASVLYKMMRVGMDVARLNFSHGTREEHLARINLIRTLNRKYRRHVRILGDLEGYRIRIGKLKDGKPVGIKKRQVVWLTQDNVPGEGDRLPFDYQGPLSQIKKGQHIFIDDGNIALVAEGSTKTAVKTRVVIAGIVKEHKGINMPETRLTFKGLTDRDKSNLRFCVEEKLDFVAQSFVRSKDDILDLRTFLKGAGHLPKIVAKIENREGIRNIDSIMSVSDGIMVARGDMGVSLPIWEVPMIQKAIIRKCNRARKFVITATQMLESMTENYLPTRAEVSDVANAILDGTDFVMLSAETAAGAYPSESVRMMNAVIKFTEENRTF